MSLPWGAAAGARGRRGIELCNPFLGIYTVSAQRGALGFAARIRSLLCLQSCLSLWTIVPVLHFDNLISMLLHYLN